jgi:hypothetical protein
MLIVLACLALSSCGGDDEEDSPTASTLEPEITSNATMFQYELGDVADVTTTLTYRWANTGSQIRATHFSTITAGSGGVFVEDADGTPVYSGVLATDGTEVSIFGAPGSWTIRVELDGFTGSVGFTIDRI